MGVAWPIFESSRFEFTFDKNIFIFLEPTDELTDRPTDPPTDPPTEPVEPTSGDVSFRLVDEQGNEVSADERGLLLYKGGTVCDDGFDMHAANAICREMGYTEATNWTNKNFRKRTFLIFELVYSQQLNSSSNSSN